MPKLISIEMIQCSRSIICKNRPAEAQFRSVLIFFDFVWRDFASLYWPAEEPLADDRGTPVENH